MEDGPINHWKLWGLFGKITFILKNSGGVLVVAAF
jgi:hypothetical protein